ncbi:hypothetical protein BV25DRAFT_1822018 [Artomyces pyxidatus]|uniref:Uncharacterized protein n=1 Tax=Artomyces pyxidatus TaxID=48021 RepID=A0ACB8TBY3_9AGAM|nr:hypothetical protein BV25DRAFT_1822018 [Artomyces pyxidatus]
MSKRKESSWYQSTSLFLSPPIYLPPIYIHNTYLVLTMHTSRSTAAATQNYLRLSLALCPACSELAVCGLLVAWRIVRHIFVAASSSSFSGLSGEHYARAHILSFVPGRAHGSIQRCVIRP